MKKLARILCVLLAAACMAACVGCDGGKKSGQSGSGADIGDVYVGVGILQLQDGRFEWSEEGHWGTYKVDGNVLLLNGWDFEAYTKHNLGASAETLERGKRCSCMVSQNGKIFWRGKEFEKTSSGKGLEGTYYSKGKASYDDMILKLADGKLVVFDHLYASGTYEIKGKDLTLTGKFGEDTTTIQGLLEKKSITIVDGQIEDDFKSMPYQEFDKWQTVRYDVSDVKVDGMYMDLENAQEVFMLKDGHFTGGSLDKDDAEGTYTVKDYEITFTYGSGKKRTAILDSYRGITFTDTGSHLRARGAFPFDF